MGADIKKLRNRIKSVDSTLHLTKAMGLVASSKIRRAMEGMYRGRQYEDAVRNSILPLLSCPECEKSPYMRHSEGKMCLIVIAGDRGLAGGYNANIFRLLRDYEGARILPIGKRACERFGEKICYTENYPYENAAALAETVCREFLEGKIDKLGVVCTKYHSLMSQEAYVRWLLPLTRDENAEVGDAIFEPDAQTVLNAVVPAYVAGMIVACARESFACEVAARRVAMDSAGKNAGEMLDTLGLAYNRARQGAITQEITEIVAGSGI